MRRMIRKLTILIAGLTMGLSLAFPSAAASIPASDFAMLMIKYAPNGTPTEGVQYSLYRFAEPDGERGFTDASGYEGIDVSGIGIDSDVLLKAEAPLVSEVSDYVESAAGLAPIVATTGSDGVATFTGLEDGLYLVKGESRRVGNTVYTPVDFILPIPYKGQNYLPAESKFTAAVDPPVPTPTPTPGGGGGGGGGGDTAAVAGVTALTEPAVLGATRALEEGEVLGARRLDEEEPAVLGASRRAQTGDREILSNIAVLAAAAGCFVLLWMLGRKSRRP